MQKRHDFYNRILKFYVFVRLLVCYATKYNTNHHTLLNRNIIHYSLLTLIHLHQISFPPRFFPKHPGFSESTSELIDKETRKLYLYPLPDSLPIQS